MSKNRHSDSPFAALKGRIAPAPAKPARPPSAAPRAAEPETDIDFAAAMQGSVRIAPPNRAEIARPRPAPLPRPRAADDTPPATQPRARIPDNDEAAFLAAMQDVVALAPSDRVDPSQLHERRTPIRPSEPGEHNSARHLEAWLDRAPDPADPAALFLHAVGTAHSVRDSGRAAVERPVPEPIPRQSEADEREVLKESVEGLITFEDRLDMGDEPAFLRDGLPRRLLTDLRRGRWVVQAELDLHGLTREEARETLARFLALRLTRGERCVRVIHGKGLGSPGKVGLLKQLSRNWLAQREEILAFCQAKPHDGGEGALLVLLRAPRRSVGETGDA